MRKINTTKTNRQAITDKSINEDFDELFENFDFGEEKENTVLIKASDRKSGRPKIGRKLSVIIPEDLISLLEKAGKKKGVGYQTMIRIICSEKINEYITE